MPHPIMISDDDMGLADVRRIALGFRAPAQDRHFFFPAFLGPFGWLGLDLTAANVDRAEITELVDASFRMVATKKLVSQREER